MQICCSQNLLEFSQEELALIEKPELFSWSVTCEKQLEKMRIFVSNDATGIAFMLNNLPNDVFENLTALLTAGIHHVLQSIGIEERTIVNYLQQAGEFLYTQSRGPIYLARVEALIAYTHEDAMLIEEDAIFQEKLSFFINEMPVSQDADDVTPAQEMITLLEQFAEKTPEQPQRTKRPAFDMVIQLDVEDYLVARRLCVPQDFTFSQLHECLQVAFNRENTHPYSFYAKNDYHEIQLMPDLIVKTMTINELKPIIAAETVRLAEIFIPGATYSYAYRFKDAWNFTITVHSFCETAEPTCLLAVGICPPESIGGPDAYGYVEEMLEHIEVLPPEEQMQLRLIQQELEIATLDIAQINRELRTI